MKTENIFYKNLKVTSLKDLAIELEPNWKPNWKDNKGKFYIYYRTNTNDFSWGYTTYYKTCGAVYMSYNTATKICNLLNDGKLPELATILKED